MRDGRDGATVERPKREKTAMSRLLDKIGASDGTSSGASDNTTAVTGFLNEPGKWSQTSLLSGATGTKKVARNTSLGGTAMRGGLGQGTQRTARGFNSKMAVAELSEGLKDISQYLPTKKRSVATKVKRGAKKGKTADHPAVPTTLPSLDGTNGSNGANGKHSNGAHLPTNGDTNGKHVKFAKEHLDPESTLVQNLGGSSEEESDVDPEVANIKTSKDVIDYYIRHGHNAQIKLFHCNTMPQGDNFNPYQLQVVDRQKVNTEHFTISSSGVVHVQSATHAEFTPLGEWIREQSIFNLLTQMKFFKYYIVNKMFKSWWKNVNAN